MSLTYVGFVLILVGGVWWLGTRLSGLVPSFFRADTRHELFNAYLLLSDHVATCGTDAQKQAMETILPCIACKQEKASS